MFISSQNVNSTGCTKLTEKTTYAPRSKAKQYSHGQKLSTVFPLFLIYVTYNAHFVCYEICIFSACYRK